MAEVSDGVNRRIYDIHDVYHEIERAKGLIDEGYFVGLTMEGCGRLHKELWIIQSTLRTFVGDNPRLWQEKQDDQVDATDRRVLYLMNELMLSKLREKIASEKLKSAVECLRKLSEEGWPEQGFPPGSHGNFRVAAEKALKAIAEIGNPEVAVSDTAPGDATLEESP